MTTSIELDEQLARKLDLAAQDRQLSVPDLALELLRNATESWPTKPARIQFVQRTHDFGIHIESPCCLLIQDETEEYLSRLSKK